MKTPLGQRARSLAPKLALAILSPVILLGLAEGALRLADVGYPTRFLVADRIGDRAVYRDNLFFTYRFINPALARSPSPIVVDRKKPDGVFRVVVLGESAAQGDPLPEFGVSRLLAPLLEAGLATGKVEVINAAIAAISSPVILEIARDLPRLQPDLVILYVGNNEVIGPFGPGTVFTGFFNADWVPWMAIKASRLRLNQALRLAMALAADRRAPQHFTGVEMFIKNQIARDDPRLAAMQRRYRKNILRLIDLAQAAGARVLVSSVAINVGDCPPSASFQDPALSPGDRERWNRLYAEGTAARKDRDWNRALDLLRQAAALDGRHAETQYLVGQCLDHLDNRAGANLHYRLARDLDGFRYRTDSALNAILRECARQKPSTLWVDAETAFQEFPDARDPDLFVDHVHFTFSGTFHLARLWAEAIIRQWPQPGVFHDPPALPGESDLRERMLFTPLAELAMIQPIISRFQRPPFDRQLDTEARLAKYREKTGELIQAVRTTELEPLREKFARILRDHPGDPYWAKQWGQWLLTFQRYTEVGPELADSIARYPHLMLQRAIAAQALAALGKTAEAAEMLADWQKKQGFFVAAEIGPQLASLAAEGRLPEAIDYARQVEHRTRRADYRHRIRLEADKVEAAQRDIEQAKGLIQLGDDPKAAALLDRANQAIRSPEPAYWMGGILARRRENPMPYLRQAFQIWSEPRSSYHAGLWRAKGHAPDEARAYFETAARGAGDDFELIRSLAWVYLAYPDANVRSPERAAALAPALERGLAHQVDPRLSETLAAVRAAGIPADPAATGADNATNPPAPWPRHQMPMNYF